MPTGAHITGVSAANTYALSSWVFLRLLGLIYLAAFASLAPQIKGLVGSHGILPATQLLAPKKRLGWRRLVVVPTLGWISSSDNFLVLLCWGGAAIALLLVLDIVPLISLVLLWVLYLSLFSLCRLFLSYQWDVLLLETGFLAILLRPLEILPRFPPTETPSKVIIMLLWWLLFRLMFSSGVVKLRSRDLTWQRLTALCHHYQTQPLPTPLAWFAHQWPRPLHKICVLFVLAVELAVPFLIFAPAPGRQVAACLFILLMVLIEATGNYSFFNLLGIALSVLLIDDLTFASTLNRMHAGQLHRLSMTAVSPAAEWFGILVGVVLFVLSWEPIVRLFRYELNWLKPLSSPLRWLYPFHLVSSYGLFAVMTTERPEIIIEGSADGVTWLAYGFKWKPCDPKRAPRFVAPHQPRLDWQMWFAALSSYQSKSWLSSFLKRLLEGSPAVLSLLKSNPFPTEPPRYIRGVVFDYRFTNLAGLRATGAWWQRERRGLYSPELELTDTN